MKMGLFVYMLFGQTQTQHAICIALFFRLLIDKPTSWSRILLEKLIVTQLVKKFPAFYWTQTFITVSQEPATGPYPEPDVIG